MLGSWKERMGASCPVIRVTWWSAKLQTAGRMQTVRRYGPPIQLFGLRERLDQGTPANRRRRNDPMRRMRSPNWYLGRVEGARETRNRPEHGFATSGRDRDRGSLVLMIIVQEANRREPTKLPRGAA